MIIRIGSKKDIHFLQEMLFEAFFWDPAAVRPNYEEFMSLKKIKKLLDNWGRTGDISFIAEKEDIKAGAIWCRLFSNENHSYGYVSHEIPELGMAILPDFRSQGLGRKLLRKLIEEIQKRKIPALSLSVDPSNFALKLYKSEGFIKIDESGTSWTLIKKLHP